MKKSLMNIFGFMIIVTIFVGCTDGYRYGVKIPSKSKLLKNKNITVFVDNSGTIKAEGNFLDEVKSHLEKDGLNAHNIFFIKNSVTNKQNIKSVSTNENTEGLLSGVRSAVDNVSWNELITFYNATYVKHHKKPKNFKYSFKIKNRTLVSTKKYESELDVFIDFMHINKHLYQDYGIWLAKKYGYHKLVLDGNEMRKNRLVLRPLTLNYPVKDIIVGRLERLGYRVVDNKNDAVNILEVENLAFARGDFLKGSTRSSYILEAKASAKASQNTMDLASGLGTSNNFAAGLGLALFALDYLSDSNREEFLVANYVIKYYNKGFEDKPSIIQPNAKTFRHYGKVKEQYEKKMAGDFIQIAMGITTFMKDGGHSTNERILVRSERHPQVRFWQSK